jgi:hypothetical protein
MGKMVFIAYMEFYQNQPPAWPSGRKTDIFGLYKLTILYVNFHLKKMKLSIGKVIIKKISLKLTTGRANQGKTDNFWI